MKKVIVMLIALMGAAQVNARVIVYYGSSKIINNSVTCKPSAKTCAVVITAVADDISSDRSGRIKIYGPGEIVIQEHGFQDYFVSKNSSFETKITWLP